MLQRVLLRRRGHEKTPQVSCVLQCAMCGSVWQQCVAVCTTATEGSSKECTYKMCISMCCSVQCVAV